MQLKLQIYCGDGFQVSLLHLADITEKGVTFQVFFLRCNPNFGIRLSWIDEVLVLIQLPRHCLQKSSCRRKFKKDKQFFFHNIENKHCNLHAYIHYLFSSCFCMDSSWSLPSGTISINNCFIVKRCFIEIANTIILFAVAVYTAFSYYFCFFYEQLKHAVVLDLLVINDFLPPVASWWKTNALNAWGIDSNPSRMTNLFIYLVIWEIFFLFDELLSLCQVGWTISCNLFVLCQTCYKGENAFFGILKYFLLR